MKPRNRVRLKQLPEVIEGLGQIVGGGMDELDYFL